MTRIKFCGFTRVQDVTQAVLLGVDALGFVFYPKSPRFVTPEQAATLMARVPAFVTCVGLFVDASPQYVEDTAKKTRLNLVQFHGDETPEACAAVGLPYIRAVRMRDDIDVRTEIDLHPQASGFLLDAYRPGIPGGTGAQFDWKRIPQTDAPVILAGGLNPTNAKDAIRQVAPWALDVSGGIESAPGEKDPDKMARFIAACRET